KMRLIGRILVSSSLIAGAGVIAPATATAATPSPQVKIRTTTKLTASSHSISRNSWIKFTAKVSSRNRRPTGWVTFVDRKNGSALDTAKLRNGTATFKTAALARGSRPIVVRYIGNRTFAASTSPALSVWVARGGPLSTAYQIDPAH